jgi:hypothetical protein
MPTVEEPSESVPEDSRAAIDSAWETFRHAKQRRHELHEVVRTLLGVRQSGGFDDRLGEVTGRNI